MRAGLGWDVAVARTVVLIVVLAVWQFASGRLVDPILIGSPVGVAGVLRRWFADLSIVHHWAITMKETFLGFLLGFTVGSVLGGLMGSFARLSGVMEPYVFFLYSVPRIALAPLFIVWFGIGDVFKVIFVAFIVLFMALINMFYGMRDVEPWTVYAVRLMGASTRQLYQKVIIPQMMLWMFASMKIALPFALIGAIVAEFLAANAGLGFLIYNASSILDTDAVLAGVCVLAFTGMVLNMGISWMEDRAMHWKKGVSTVFER
jgi:NitT/TauT family transport system permease protein